MRLNIIQIKKKVENRVGVLRIRIDALGENEVDNDEPRVKD